MEARVLCLSYNCPPAIDPQAILIGKMIPAWAEAGLFTVVLTSEHPHSWNPPVPAYGVGRPPLRHTLGSTTLGRAVSRYLEARKWVDLGMKLLSDHHLNLIFSFSNPAKTNIFGAELASRTGAPFVSHFSDPWADNLLRPIRGVRAWRTRRAESRVVTRSARIVFTNTAAQQLVMGKYSGRDRDRARVIPHCFRQADYPASSPRHSGYILAHVGTFFAGREPNCLLAALRILLEREKWLGQSLRVRLVGAVGPSEAYPRDRLVGLLEEYEVSHLVEILPVLPYKESLAEMCRADCLVVVDVELPSSPYLPSKVVDYAGSGKPVLAISSPSSPTSKFVEAIGGEAFSHSQPEALAERLGELIQGRRLDLRAEAASKYEVRQTTESWRTVFLEALASGRHKGPAERPGGRAPNSESWAIR
jgi:glycosyltransferase involved in cell wall biosynthesis